MAHQKVTDLTPYYGGQLVPKYPCGAAELGSGVQRMEEFESLRVYVVHFVHVVHVVELLSWDRGFKEWKSLRV